MQTAGVLAKQLVRLRHQRAKSLGLSSQITATGHQMKVLLFIHSCPLFLKLCWHALLMIADHHVTVSHLTLIT